MPGTPTNPNRHAQPQFGGSFCWISKDKLRVAFHLFGLTGGRFHCMYYISLHSYLRLLSTSMTLYLNTVVIYIVTKYCLCFVLHLFVNAFFESYFFCSPLCSLVDSFIFYIVSK